MAPPCAVLAHRAAPHLLPQIPRLIERLVSVHDLSGRCTPIEGAWPSPDTWPLRPVTQPTAATPGHPPTGELPGADLREDGFVCALGKESGAPGETGRDRAVPGLQPQRVATILNCPDQQRVERQRNPTSRTIPDALA
jgi:hypothetical protein